MSELTPEEPLKDDAIAAEVISETEPAAEPEADTEAEVDADADVEADAEADAEAEPTDAYRAPAPVDNTKAIFADDERALLPHVVPEFLTWLWFASERDRGSADLGGEMGRIDYWIDDRIAFRDVDTDKPRAVMTGESPSTSPEARAALAGGKVLREIRLVVRREDREFYVTLKGPNLDLQGVKLPQMIKGAAEEVMYDRMALYEELHFMLAGLFHKFAGERCGNIWADETLPTMRAWVAGETDAD